MGATEQANFLSHQESPIYNSYYQWVSIFLFAIAVLFYAPRGLWVTMEGGLMKHFCKGTSSKLVEEYDEKIDKLLKVKLQPSVEP